MVAFCPLYCITENIDSTLVMMPVNISSIVANPPPPPAPPFFLAPWNEINTVLLAGEKGE